MQSVPITHETGQHAMYAEGREQGVKSRPH